MGDGDKGKIAGGAAVGAGGILVAALKGGAGAEMHAVEATTRAAARAGEIGVVSHGASELGGAAARAGELGAARGALHAGEHGEARLLLAGAAGEVEVRSLQPVAFLADDGTTAAKALAPAGTKTTAKAGGTTASRTSKVKEVLSKAGEEIDAKELLDRLNDVWDLSQSIDDGEEEEVEKKFQAKGVDFKKDVVPGVQGKPLPALPGATQTLLSDGHRLVPAARLPDVLAPVTLTAEEERALAFGHIAGYAIYVETPIPASVRTARDVKGLLLLSHIDPGGMQWIALAPSGPLPAVLEHASTRYVRVSEAPDAGAPPSRVVIVAARR